MNNGTEKFPLEFKLQSAIIGEHDLSSLRLLY